MLEISIMKISIYIDIQPVDFLALHLTIACLSVRLQKVTRILFSQPPFECSKALSYLVIAHSHIDSTPTAC